VSLSKPLITAGSNLFELIEFSVTRSAPTLYGVNVAKVREVIRLPHIVPCLTTCPEVLGVFNLRGVPIPAIHLSKAIGYTDDEVNTNSQVIVTEFSRRVAGFVVSGTRRIRRVSWDKVLPPTSDAFSSITGMMLIENQDFIFILDFERILIDIENRGRSQAALPNFEAHVPDNERMTLRRSSDNRAIGENPQDQATGPSQRAPLIMVVDDSPTARRALKDILRALSLDVIEFPNGEQAWSALNDPHFMEQFGPIDLVISDVEMPRLDGYSLVKRMKESATLKTLPIVLHTSLTGDVNRDRAKQSGADAYVSKFNRREIMEAIKATIPHVAVELRRVS